MPADRMRLFAGLLCAALGLLGQPSVGAVEGQQAAPPMQPYLQRSEEGWIDWQNGLIYGVGKASLRLNQGSKLQAMRAAQALARANIVKLAGHIQLDDKQSLDSYKDGSLSVVLRAVIHDTEHASEFVDQSPDPYYKVTRVAPIKGVEGLTSELLPHLTDMGLAGTGSAAPAAPEDDADAPWLVLDARRFQGAAGVKPALFPKIVSSSGDVLYQAKDVDLAALRQRGMAEYVVSDQAPGPSSGPNTPGTDLGWLWRALGIRDAVAQEGGRRRGRRREFVVKDVRAVQGLEKTNLVVSDQDARALKRGGTSGKILKKCHVVVVVSSAVGGIEGRLASPHLLASRAR